MSNLEEINYEFPEITDKSQNIIKVIGVGGGGSNAVKNMFREGVSNVSFAICNTDSQALSQSPIPLRIQLGEEGLGVGGDPIKGKQAAMDSLEKITHLFEDNTQMVFITAGMGGGTGTGAAPVIAREARSKGLLTVGVVTLPFAFEKKARIEKALDGIDELKKEVDALLVINNQRLMEIYSDGVTTVEDAFQKADDILTVATRSIAEIVTEEGVVNRDFRDVQTVMKDGGCAIMSIGRASGEHRIQKAMAAALNSPLLSNVEIEKAQRLLYVIYSCENSPVMVSELEEVNSFMDTLSEDIEVLWGQYRDNTLGDEVKVTIIATGFDKERKPDQKAMDEIKRARINELINCYYGKRKEETVVPVIDEQENQENTDDTSEDMLQTLAVAATESEDNIEENNYNDDELEETPAVTGTRSGWAEKLKNWLVSVLNEPD